MLAASPASTAQPFSLFVAARFVSTVWAGQRRAMGSFNLVSCVGRVERGKRACDKVSTALDSEEYVQCRVPSESARESPAQVWIPVTDGLPQHDMSLTGGYCEGSLEEGKEAHPSDSPLDNEGG
ncbi:hypothetical protein Landi51_07812 [Colletotrichum acutatum]